MRRALAVGALLAVLVLAGCTGTVSEADLAENASTNWSSDERAHLTVGNETYRAVYQIENRTTVELYQRDPLGQEHPLAISALRFRAPNGTVYNASAFEVEETGRRLILTLPARAGQLAFSAPVDRKRVTARTVVDGAYRVTLPEKTTVGLPILSRVQPGNETVDRTGNRTAITWSNVTADRVSVEYYHRRDPLLLGVLGGLSALALLVVGGYYLFTLRRIRQRRDEAGLDVDLEE